MAVFDVFAYTPLFLTDSVNINIKVLNVADVLALTETLTTNIILQSVGDVLNLNDAVILNKTIALGVTQNLHLSQDGRRTPIEVTASDHLELWHEAIIPENYPLVSQTLALIDTAVASVAKGVYDTLTLTQSILIEKSISISAENTLVMKSDATVYKPDQFWTSYDVVVVNP